MARQRTLWSARENRSRLAGLLSRRNTASHRCIIGPNPGRSPSVRSRPQPGRHGRVFSPSLSKVYKKTADPMGVPPDWNNQMTSYGGMTHIR